MRFCTLTLGCKVNQYETQAIEHILVSRGHIHTEPGSGCDVCIINTCAVTAESSRKSRQAVRRMKSAEPAALIAVCGCMTQLEPELRVHLGADLTGGSGGRRGFALEVERLWQAKQAEPREAVRAETRVAPQHAGVSSACQRSVEAPPFCSVEAPRETSAEELSAGAFGAPHSAGFEELPPGSASGRTRALLKIQDGCDNYCAYCIIPYARGRVRSLQPHRAAEYAAQLAEQGFREIVITGIEISSYGKDLAQGTTLTDVIRLIADAAQDVRIRLSSLDPGVVTEEFCGALVKIPNLCGHFHLSLQSGCDDTLLRMGRKYDTRAVRNAIELLRERFPNCGITSDLITGFPGETEDEFKRTMDFITAAEFSGMHIFPFSPRPGTRAAGMPDQVAKGVRSRRAAQAAEAAEAMAGAFRQKQVGSTLNVLFERERAGVIIGHSENYIEVAVKKKPAENAGTGAAANGSGIGSVKDLNVSRNSVHSVQIYAADTGFVWAEIV